MHPKKNKARKNNASKNKVRVPKIRFRLPVLLAPRLNLLLLALLLSLAACGGKRTVQGEAPFVRITAVELTEQWLDIELSVRNVNTVPLHMEFIHFQLSVGENSQASHDAALASNVVANGSERLSFRIDVPPDQARSRLQALEDGDIVSLPYQLEGEIIDPATGALKFKNAGHLYPLPGRPGHFR